MCQTPERSVRQIGVVTAKTDKIFISTISRFWWNSKTIIFLRLIRTLLCLKYNGKQKIFQFGDNGILYFLKVAIEEEYYEYKKLFRKIYGITRVF